MKALTVAGVNLRRFLRERSNIFFVFIFPIALILVIGSLFGGDVRPVLGVVVPPGSGPLASDLVARLEADEGIEVRAFAGEREVLDAVERGAVAAGLVVPEGYDRDLSSGRPVEVAFQARPDGVGPTLQLTVSAALGDQASVVQAAGFAAETTGAPFPEALAAAEALDERVPRLSVERETVGELAFGEDVQRFDVGAPSQLVLFMFLTGLTASAALIQSRQLGVTRRMLSTPTSARSIVAGEALGRLAVVLFQGVYIMVATRVLFRVDWGDPVGAIALLVAFALVGAGAGLLMGAVFSNDQQAGGVGVLLGLGMAALGGSMVPLEIFSDTMRRVAHATPHAWAMDGFAELVRRNGGLGDVLPEVGVLLAYAAALLALAAWRLRAVMTR